MATKSGNSDIRDDLLVDDDGGTASSQVEQLLKKYGDDADIVAVQRADLHFARGDTVGGARWLKIFRAIARSCHRSQKRMQ
jgi:hypothetical protein